MREQVVRHTLELCSLIVFVAVQLKLPLALVEGAIGVAVTDATLAAWGLAMSMSYDSEAWICKTHQQQ